VLAADYCEEFGVRLARLDDEAIAALDASGVMNPAYSRGNPLDLVGDALPERFRAGVFTLLERDYVHGLIVIQVVTTMTDPRANAQIILEARRKFPDKPVLAVFMGGKYSAEGVKLLLKHGVPEFNDPRKAVQAMAALCGVL
jgi:acetyltransferase